MIVTEKTLTGGELTTEAAGLQFYHSAPQTNIQLKFWGTRGSIPVSGASNIRYGGNTSCVTLTSDTGHLFILDCGSGARELGQHLLQQGGGVKGYMLFSHTHWDHIQGFPFFGPVFRPGNQFNIMGWGETPEVVASILAGQMERRYFPVSLDALPSQLAFYSISRQQGEAVVDGVKLKTRVLKHPLPSIAYRMELGGRTLVYATDNEPLSVPPVCGDELFGDEVIDRNLVELARSADILIHDAQYSNAELNEKVGWGHSSVEVAVDTAIKAGVKKLVLYHHDPAHDDATIDGLVQAGLRRAAKLGYAELQIIAASDGLTLDFEPVG